MQPDFNRLKVFYYIFSRKSIVAAANELHITPSAVSQHLQKLEFELKTPLFTRLHKKLVPTAAGEKLFGIVEPFVDDLEMGIRNIRQANEKPSGLLRIGAPIEFGKKYLPGIFASFRRKYPDVTFFLKLGDPATLFPLLNEGLLDFALVDEFLTLEQFFGDFSVYSIEPAVNEQVILACSKEYYDKEVQKDHSFDNLVNKNFISYQCNDLILRAWFRHHFERKPPKLNVVMTVDNIHTVLSGVRHSLGLGIIATHLAWEDICRGDIVPITTCGDELINRISLVQFQDKIPNLTEKTFQAHFRKEIHLTHLGREGRKPSQN